MAKQLYMVYRVVRFLALILFIAPVMALADPPPSPANPATSTPVATAGQPSGSFAGKAGTNFTIYRSEGGKTATQVYSGSQTSFTDSSTLKPNTIYQYAVTSDSDQSQTVFMTIRTPLNNDWNVIAVPCSVTGVNASALFNTPVSDIYQWIPTGATPESSDTQLGYYAKVTKITPGFGYFVKAANSSTLLTCDGNPISSPVTVTLQPGWTMIANPKTANMTNIGTNWLIDGSPLATAVANKTVGVSVYWWNGTTYDAWPISNNPQIEPWKGYWLINLDSVHHTLTIQ